MSGKYEENLRDYEHIITAVVLQMSDYSLQRGVQYYRIVNR